MNGKTPAELVQALREQNTILGIRGEASLGSLCDGLDYLMARAATGDVGARAILKHYRDQLHELDQLPLSIEVVRQS